MEDMELEEGMEMVSFGIIANAGDARSYAFGALEAAKKGNFEEADELLKKSSEAAVEAHHMQTELLTNEASEADRKWAAELGAERVCPVFIMETVRLLEDYLQELGL